MSADFAYRVSVLAWLFVIASGVIDPPRGVVIAMTVLAVCSALVYILRAWP